MESPLKALVQRVKLTELNPYITCQLCGGYLVEATTITECLHTFCKSCIIKYIESSIFCPTCDTKIHETWPYYSIRLDRTMQDVVHKLLPQIEKEERRRQKEFYKERGIDLPPPNATSIRAETPKAHLEENHVSLVFEYIGASSDLDEPIQPLEKKFVRVTDRATVGQVQRFLSKKLQLNEMFEVDVISNDEIMEPDITLQSIAPMARKLDGLMVLGYGVAIREEARQSRDQ